jgi:hypothetical protein
MKKEIENEEADHFDGWFMAGFGRAIGVQWWSGGCK